MKPLPFPIAEPLHILPWWLVLIKWALIALLLYIIFRILYKKAKPYYYKLISLLKPQSRQTVDINKERKIGSLINRIKNANLQRKTYRRGLFELSGEMKTFLKRKTGIHAEEMTALEIETRFSSPIPGEFFRALEQTVFQEQAPGESDLIELCGRAQKLAKIKLKTERGVKE